jgi:tetratricopeptide (TPR) repeat protein
VTDQRTRLALLLGVLTSLVWGRVVLGGWILDDRVVLEQQLVRLHGLGDALAPPPDLPQWSPIYYRPVIVASYQLDRAVSQWFDDSEQTRQRVFHTHNLLVHVIVALLLFRLACCWWDARAAFVAALLFAVWPVVTEPVAWVTGRSDLWAALGLFAATSALLSSRYLVAGLAALLAMLSKESALIWVALCPLLARPSAALEAGRGRTERTKLLLCALVPTLCCLAARALLLPAAPTVRDFAQPIEAAFAILGGLVEIALVPRRGVSAHYDVPPFGVPVLLIAAALTAWGWWKADRPMRFALALFWLPLIPASYAQLQIGPDRPLGERYVYVSVAALSLIATALATRLSWSARWRALVAAVVAIGSAAITIPRIGIWRDEASYWAAFAAAAPDAAEVNLRQGGLAQRREDLEAARRYYERGLRTAQTAEFQSQLLFNLGTLDLRQDDPHSALEKLDRAAALAPSLTLLPFQRGAAHYRIGQKSSPAPLRAKHWAEAERLLREMIARQPEYGRAHFLLGKLLLETGRPEEGRAALEAVIRVEPNGKEAQQAQRLLQPAPGG